MEPRSLMIGQSSLDTSPGPAPPLHLVPDERDLVPDGERAGLDPAHRSPRRYPALVVPDRPAPVHLARIARTLSTRTDLWRPLLRVDPVRPWRTRVAGGQGWEAWLRTWAPGQSTDLHDHGPSLGALVVLSGELHEITGPRHGRRAPRSSRRVLTPPDVVSFRAGHVHALEGAGTRPAVSLHVYAPALSPTVRHAMDRVRRDRDRERDLRPTGTDGTRSVRRG